MFLRSFFLSLSLVFTSHAASPLRVPQTFSITADVGIGNSVFVVGNHLDLGTWDVTKSIKLRWTPGNVWTGSIGIQSGTALRYKFIRRAAGSTNICDGGNTSDLGPIQSLNIPAQPDAPYLGKTILYYSSWARAFILYRDGTQWLTREMTRIGAGRFAGENQFRLSGIGVAGETLEFVPNDNNGHYDNPPGGGNYLTDLDAFILQDGGVYNYQPAASVSAPSIVSRQIQSSYSGIPARGIRIYLPRGYTENTWKSYPVLYFHDGQNVFDPGGTFGSWSADAIATKEISQGRMRECILIGIDNTSNRINEYLPPTDSYGGNPGMADRYRDFVINNVRPAIDSAYRSLNDRANTLTAGSSMGGLVSLYMGRESTTFGKIGILSPAFWTAPNYMNQFALGSKISQRTYIDMGTAEGGTQWPDVLNAYDIFLKQGYAPNSDLRFITGCGDGHNEAAWKRRLPEFYHYVLNIWDEPNAIAQREFPSRVSLLALDSVSGRATLRFPSLFGFRYDIERSPTLKSWENATSISAEPLPWSVRSLELPASGSSQFWRLKTTAP